MMRMICRETSWGASSKHWSNEKKCFIYLRQRIAIAGKYPDDLFRQILWLIFSGSANVLHLKLFFIFNFCETWIYRFIFNLVKIKFRIFRLNSCDILVSTFATVLLICAQFGIIRSSTFFNNATRFPSLYLIKYWVTRFSLWKTKTWSHKIWNQTFCRKRSNASLTNWIVLKNSTKWLTEKGSSKASRSFLESTSSQCFWPLSGVFLHSVKI